LIWKACPDHYRTPSVFYSGMDMFYIKAGTRLSPHFNLSIIWKKDAICFIWPYYTLDFIIKQKQKLFTSLFPYTNIFFDSNGFFKGE
jgi:hypothetical protein